LSPPEVDSGLTDRLQKKLQSAMPWSDFFMEIANSATFLQILRVGLQILFYETGKRYLSPVS
jgi:hypothetical protein